MRVEYASFPERAARARYIARRYSEILSGKVLDVGCDQAVLRELLPGREYMGIDVGGKPDRIVNLERTERLPFEDASFDCVVCADVLEHLDNLHHVFGELVRLARGHLILSLPNNWTNARQPIARGRGRIGHYGLPAEAPADRHKWFFSLQEAVAFLKAQPLLQPIDLVEMHAMEKPRLAPLRWARRLTHRSQMRYLNRFAHTLWAVLAKRPSA